MADERMRELFLSGKTTDRAYRGETLGKLYADVRAKKNDIVGCLAGDLGRPAKECALIYSSMIEKPARIAAKKDWTKWRWLAPVLPDFITTGRVYRKPLGLVRYCKCSYTRRLRHDRIRGRRDTDGRT